MVTPLLKPSRSDRQRGRIDTSSLAFPKEHFDVDQKFRAFVAGHSCLLSGMRNEECGGVTEFAHITTGGRGIRGSDFYGVPLCTNHHQAGPGAYHKLGSVDAFDSVHGTNLWRECAGFLAAWIRRMK